MAILPGDASWASYAILLIVLTALTLAIAFKSEEVKDLSNFVWRKAMDTLLHMRM